MNQDELSELQALSEEALDELRIEVLNEIERRANMARIPAQVALMGKLYTDGGGSIETLQAALTPDPTDPPAPE